MTAVTQPWIPLAEGLVQVLIDRDALHDPKWRAALTAVPRHELVPRYYVQNTDASWREVTAADPEYLGEVYRNQPLVTSISDQGRGFDEPDSSSSQPSLMIRMLEVLGVTRGDRVLEIGTGTGYNAGLMSHRLGAENVFSVDIAAGLVEQARASLSRLRYVPRLAAGDGALGWAEHGPYDRIIATCSVPKVPATWARQLVDGGMLLTDIKVGTGGNLALLHRHGALLEGRFTSRWAGFMAMRHLGEASDVAQQPKAPGGSERLTTAPAAPWNSHQVVWLLACLNLPANVRFGYLLAPSTRTPRTATLAAPDGSWCEVDLDTVGADTGREVRESGPTPLWSQVERAHRQWRNWGEPQWERFGLTVTPEQQLVWLDTASQTVAELS